MASPEKPAFGGACDAHADPDQVSATVPTALHVPAGDEHATPVRPTTEFESLDGSGTVWSFQVDPAHPMAVGLLMREPKFPTASHFAVLTHATASSELSVEPDGSGVDCTDHDVPAQISARNATSPELSVACPTATHECAVLHETPDSSACVVPAGNGGACAVHALPFQVSASGCEPPVPVNSPTATQELVSLHDTPARAGLVPPAGLAIETGFHVFPFQSAPSEPTAMHDAAAAHATAVRAEPAPIDRGSDCSTQVLPFQPSANGDVVSLSGELTKFPTASHAFEAWHDTPVIWAPQNAEGFAVACKDQLFPFHPSPKEILHIRAAIERAH